MINKQKLWFLTLFSLILVLSVYYITMPNDLLDTNKIDNKSSVVVNVKDSNVIDTLKELNDEERVKEIKELNQVLSNVNSTIEEKNNAYEKLQLINETKSKEEKLQNKVKEEYNLDSFIKIDNNQVRVNVKSSNHSYELANNIIRSIQEEFKDKMYISVKFQ